jgi:hypothetical protein
MKIAGAFFGFVVLVVVLVVWYRMYRSLKGDDGPMFSFLGSKPKKEKSDNSLEALIASYKRGEALPGDAPAAPAAFATPQQPAATPAVAMAAKAGAAPAMRIVTAHPGAKQPAPTAIPADVHPVAVAVKRDVFITGATKLVYMVCKAGLRDHHVFAHVPLRALSTGGAIDPMLALTTVDLLVCNAAMAPVAAIDVIEATSGPADAVKAGHLKGLGLRYLRFSAKSLPRPDALHALLYKM